MLRPEGLPQTQHDLVPLAGGYDQLTSAYNLAPGHLRDCINFACLPVGGYYRIPGYERHDGRKAPSTASFITLDVVMEPGEPIPPVGSVGAFGNITGTVCYVDPFGNFVGLTKTITTFSSTFVPGPIDIGGGTIGQATEIHTQLSLRDFAIVKAAAANIYRADIQPVPGSGPIRGVLYFKDVTYAFRDNAAGTVGDIYRSTVSGWQKVTLGHTVGFDGAGPLPKTGDVLTQSAVTATVERTVVTEGDPTANTAKGYLVLSNLAGGNFAAGAATFPTAQSINLTGAEVAITRLPGGRCTFSIGNFFSQASTQYVYGADGVNDGFEFDGDTYTPIPVSVPNGAKPKYAQVHSNHLFFAVGSSLIHSALGNPYNFEVINGAGEIGTGGNITGLIVQVGDQSGGALMVFARNSMWVLYGTSAQDWKFVNYNVGVGAWDYTAQNLFDAFALDDRGITAMKQTLNYGNFDPATLTHNIQPFIGVNRGLAVCSGLSRPNSQYRVFFNNGYGIYTTVNPQGLVGHGIVLFPDKPVCMYDSEASDGGAVQLFGTADGYVMWNDVGTSFDGKAISAFINTNINAVKSPRIRKRFRRTVLELYGQAYVEMQVGYSFEWASSKILPHAFENGELDLSGMPFWDQMVWDAFFWDGRANDVVSVELNGTGENMQMMVFVDADFIEQFALKSAIFHFTPRRGNR